MSDELRTIRLYGPLGTKFGRVHQLAVESPAEAVRALCLILPGFEAYLMSAKDNGLGFSVFIDKKNLSREELQLKSECGDIRIAPMILGSKNGGFFQIILGVVLIVVGVVVNYFAPGAGAIFIKLGITMIIGGVVQLLSPQPKGQSAQDRPENTPNQYFNGPVNTQAQGNPVPLLYGENIIGSAVISAALYNDDIYVPYEYTPGFGDPGDGGFSGCVTVDSILPGGKRAGDVRVGDVLELYDPYLDLAGEGRVTHSEMMMMPTWRILTKSGVELECSQTAPIPVKRGAYLFPNQLALEEVKVNDGGRIFWDEVADTQWIGVMPVQAITVENKCFWAGKVGGSYILHHNLKNVDEEVP